MSAHSLDFVTFGLYLVVVFAFGIYMSGREETSSDFFLAGRSLPWYAIAMSLFASNISSGSAVALAGDAYRHGIAVSTLEWGAIIGLITLTFVFLPFYRSTSIYTTPEFLERRYGPTARMLFALTVMAVELLVYLPFVFYAGGLFLGVMFGVPFIWSVVGIAVFVGAYTTYGGLAAVVWTDVLQGVLTIVGGATVTILGLIKLGGVSGFLEKVPESHLHVCLSADHPAYPFPASMIGGYLLITIYYWCQNQTIVQRTFAGRTEWDSRMGAIGACYIKLILPFTLVMPGVIAAALLPDLGTGKDADQALPILIKYVAPSGPMGLIMAAMVASLLLSADSSLNSLATIFTNDFYRRWISPSASEHALVRVGRISSVGILILAVIRALTLQETPSLMQFLQVGLAYIAAPVVVVFAMGVFWRGATSVAAVCTLLISPFVCLASQLAHHWLNWWPVHLVYWLPIAVAILVLYMLLLSLATPRKNAAELEGLIWSPKSTLGFDQKMLVQQDSSRRRGEAGLSLLWLDHRIWASLAILLMILEIYWLR